MAEFKSWQSFWRFEEAIIQRMRYVHDDESKEFLEGVRQTAVKRVNLLPLGTQLWRAQLGNDWEPTCINDVWPRISIAAPVEVLWESSGVLADHPCPSGNPCPYGAARMKPLPESAIEGRANPKGIPVLYLATNSNTAIGEVRPWIGAYVSVGLFCTHREVRLVDCTTGPLRFIHIGREPPVDKREELVWTCIGDAFARPITPNDAVADYAATQTIAELLHADGYDGIRYRSSLGNGHNIALFDVDAADPTEGHLFQVENVTFAPKETANPVRY